MLGETVKLVRTTRHTEGKQALLDKWIVAILRLISELPLSLPVYNYSYFYDIILTSCPQGKLGEKVPFLVHVLWIPKAKFSLHTYVVLSVFIFFPFTASFLKFEHFFFLTASKNFIIRVLSDKMLFSIVNSLGPDQTVLSVTVWSVHAQFTRSFCYSDWCLVLEHILYNM